MSSTEQPAGSVRGVVLAGGDSTRFEAGDKAVATVGSEPILSRIVSVLDQTTHRKPVIAVRTAEQQARYATTVDRPVEFVFDAPDYEGPVAGLFGAATALDARWVFCCGCDMPLLAPTAVTWLIDHLLDQQPTDRRQVAAVAIEQPDGSIEPLHTLYRRERVLEHRGRLPTTAGPRMLLSAFETVDTVCPAEAPEHVPLGRSTANVNTVGELETIRPD